MARAVALIHAAGVGTVTTLLASRDDERDPQLADAARDAVLAAVTTCPPQEADDCPATRAIGLRARPDTANGLTPGERLLLDELLDRLSRPTR